jgi:hypothetical protein
VIPPKREGSAMNDMLVTLAHWQLTVKAVRERMYSAPRRGNPKAGMPSGYWRRAGQPAKWPQRWSAMPTP